MTYDSQYVRKNMKILVIGLGSMGQRRIRNLQSIGNYDIWGFDLREDRRNNAKKIYNINIIEDFEKGMQEHKFKNIIISVPPDKHMQYMQYAVKHSMNCFVEASVVDEGMKDLMELMKANKDVKICPSCTLKFHPSLKLIKELIDSQKIGKVSNFSYHSGQYLPDWHPWEDINDYYVSNPSTGGGREIVPFELTWLNWILGDIEEIKGFFGKTIELQAPIDDTYAAVLRYKNGVLGTVVVDVVSRYATRRLIINGDIGQISWDWNKKEVILYDAKNERHIIYKEPSGHSQQGYNSNLIEEMYIEEMKHFLDCVYEDKDYPSTLDEDYKILTYLYQLEKSDHKKH